MSQLISNSIKRIIKEHLNDVVKRIIDELKNADDGSIDVEKLLEIITTLLSGCLEGRTIEELKMETLLRRR